MASHIDRRAFLERGALGAALAAAAAATGCGTAEAPTTGAPAEPQAEAPPLRAEDTFELREATVETLQAGMHYGRWTSCRLVELYLERIRDLDRKGPTLRSVIETNPEALRIAEELDAERKSRGPRSPLHGIPILIKDNVDTADQMRTSAGSLALAESIAPRDAFIVDRLRKGGAIILGKTNLSEWANFRSTRSTSGWSGRGGQCRNPFVLDRNPCGSSSGTGAAISANLGAIGIGTETDGSIVCPSNNCGLVGLKPTVGLVSRAGIIPISATQDTAGPMTRTVADAATLLSAIIGIDVRDPATEGSRDRYHADYRTFLEARGLKGARIGVARRFFGFNPAVDALMKDALTVLRQEGAVLIDPADLPTHGQFDEAELVVLLHEFKAGLNAYLASLGPKAPVKTLKDVIAFNERETAREMPYFGQELFIRAEATTGLDSASYREALAKCRDLSREKGIDAVMDAHKLDALVAPTGGPAWTTDLVNGDHFGGGSSTPAAVAGYPSITVPAGFVRGLPVGLSFFGRAWSEPVLLKLAYAFEQATSHRQPPKFLAAVEI